MTLIDRWSREFENNKCIFIEDMEDLRSQSPEEYEVLSSQNIKRLIAAPLFSNQRLAGYIGVDNPPGDLFDQVEAFLVPKNVMLTIRPGVWHCMPFVVSGEEIHILNVLPERTYANDCTMHVLKEEERIEIKL